MNFKDAIRRLTTPKETLETNQAVLDKQTVEQQSIDAELAGRWTEWLKHPISNTLLNELDKSYKQSLSSAKQYARMEDKVSATAMLNEASTLEKVINYARRNTTSIL